MNTPKIGIGTAAPSHPMRLAVAKLKLHVFHDRHARVLLGVALGLEFSLGCFERRAASFSGAQHLRQLIPALLSRGTSRHRWPLYASMRAWEGSVW